MIHYNLYNKCYHNYHRIEAWRAHPIQCHTNGADM